MAVIGALTSTAASALAIGRNGATNPVLQADCSVSSAATGVKVTGQAAAGGANVAVISSGTNENLTIDAKGSGSITLGSTSTGNIITGQNTRVASGKTWGLLDTGTATATAGAATLNTSTGKVTTEALTTAAGAAYTLTITNSQIAAADIVMVNVANGTNSQGIVMAGRVTTAAGSVVISIRNLDASVAFNGTLVVGFMVVKVA